MLREVHRDGRRKSRTNVSFHKTKTVSMNMARMADKSAADKKAAILNVAAIIKRNYILCQKNKNIFEMKMSKLRIHQHRAFLF